MCCVLVSERPLATKRRAIMQNTDFILGMFFVLFFKFMFIKSKKIRFIK